MRSASTNSTATCASSMPAEEAARAHASRTVGSGMAAPMTSTSSTAAPVGRPQVRRRVLRVLGVGRDDALHELVADDVLAAEAHEVNALDALEDVPDDQQAGLLLAREVDLRDVTGHDHARSEPEPGEEHLHLLGRRVLGLVEDHERVVERSAAHEGQRRDL